jgi:molybdenum cofactor synthesis domain-containing protein
VRAALLTIGNELVSGDVANSNSVWLSRRLETRGIRVVLSAAVPDELDAIADFVNRERVRVDHLLVTGGLGGTPDDLTREALAAAFAVPQEEVAELAGALRRRFPSHPDYAAAWALLPRGSRALVNPRGGAPGFTIANVWVFPGLPDEMEAMFELYADELGAGVALSVWRREFHTGEGEIVDLLRRAVEDWPTVELGSYPRFGPEGADVELVLKSSDPAALADLVAWLEPELARRIAPPRP